MPQWLSRFDVWPYLEEFTIDVARELRAECPPLPPLLLNLAQFATAHHSCQQRQEQAPLGCNEPDFFVRAWGASDTRSCTGWT